MNLLKSSLLVATLLVTTNNTIANTQYTDTSLANSHNPIKDSQGKIFYRLDSQTTISYNSFIANSYNANTSVIVTGQNTIWKNQNLNIGIHGSANLTLQDSANITVKNNLTINNKSTLNIALKNTLDTFIQVKNNATLNGKLNIITKDLESLKLGDFFIIINVQNNNAGSFKNYKEGDRVATKNNINLYITYQGGDGNDVELFTKKQPSGSGTQIQEYELGYTATTMSGDNIPDTFSSANALPQNSNSLFPEGSPSPQPNIPYIPEIPTEEPPLGDPQEPSEQTIPEPTTLLSLITIAITTLNKRNHR